MDVFNTQITSRLLGERQESGIVNGKGVQKIQQLATAVSGGNSTDPIRKLLRTPATYREVFTILRVQVPLL